MIKQSIQDSGKVKQNLHMLLTDGLQAVFLSGQRTFKSDKLTLPTTQYYPPK